MWCQDTFVLPGRQWHYVTLRRSVYFKTSRQNAKACSCTWCVDFQSKRSGGQVCRENGRCDATVTATQRAEILPTRFGLTAADCRLCRLCHLSQQDPNSFLSLTSSPLQLGAAALDCSRGGATWHLWLWITQTWIQELNEILLCFWLRDLSTLKSSYEKNLRYLDFIILLFKIGVKRRNY